MKNLLKKRKNKLILMTAGVIIGASIIAGAIFYSTSSQNYSRFNTTSSATGNDFINKSNLDYKNALPSIRDNNLKELEKPQPIPTLSLIHI